uniref:Oxysterol binding protein 2 n=1 Tax=Equus caballus TaxID=9796 RepID=A0A9L0SMY6_HORSE
MAHTCRGTINLCTAHFDKEDSCGIMLTNGARTYHLKASSEVERQHWITTLELAKAKAVHLMSSHSGSPVHSCIFFVVGPSSCGMWEAASA